MNSPNQNPNTKIDSIEYSVYDSLDCCQLYEYKQQITVNQ